MADDLVVVLADKQDQPPLPGQQLLDGAPHLLPQRVPGRHHHRRHRLVDQGEGAVLQLPSEDPLAVHVAQLLHLERQLHRRGVIITPSEGQEGILARQLLRKLLDEAFLLQDLLHHAGEVQEVPHDFLPPGHLRNGVLAQLEGDHHDHQDLAGVGLRAGHSNLHPGVDVNPAVGLPRDGAPHGVGDPQAQGALVFCVLQGVQGVRCLARLGHEHASVVPEEGGLPVKQVACQLQGDGDARELLHELPCREAGVVTGPASDEDQPPGPHDVVHVVLQATQLDARSLVKVRGHSGAQGPDRV
mmetsp:Transcript_8872/g.25308  ORF Transcript_8872/g.25308 Transcript_8872/m.25308 type:complete len:300 (-) Transcript_8872:1357-2256(-)